MNNKLIEGKLIEWFKEYEEIEHFKKKYSPWHKEENEELLQNFIENKEGFSWLDILGDNELKYLSIPANIHYGIPNSVIGNFDEANLFLCLINPNINKVMSDGYKSIEHNCRANVKNKVDNLEDFYKLFYQKEKIDPTANKKNFKNVEMLKNHIVNIQKNVIEQELILELDEKDQYYKNQYYKTILDLVEYKTSNELKICNLEAFPFRSKSPACGKNGVGTKILELEHDTTLLSSRIILRRLAKYFQDRNKNPKPIFLFRRYNAGYLQSFSRAIEEIVGDIDTKSFEKYLDKEHFRYLTKKDHKNLSRSDINQKNLVCIGEDKYRQLENDEWEEIKRSIL